MKILRALFALALAAALVVPVAAVAAAPVGAGPFPHGAIVALRGTLHLWVADERGTLHWGGDTRALQGRRVDGSNRTEVTLEQLRTLPRGEPWLSSGLVKIGEAIYLAKWETTESQPTLFHIQSIRDVELFGIDATNYGRFVLDRGPWEQRYNFNADRLAKAVLAPAGTAPAETWRQYTSAEMGFSVWVPGTEAPIEEQETDESGASFRAFGFTGSFAAPAQYVVAIFTAPPGAQFNPLAAEEIFNNIRTSALGSTGTLVSERAIRLGIYPGREIALTAARSGTSTLASTLRVYLAGNRLYILEVDKLPDQAAAPDVAKFLDSFRLLPS